ncbi:MAG: histidinol-phosphatase HisJ family protein [Candidatus Omnitrophota bacterium]
MNRILYDSHIHTHLCKHAIGAPGEYAAAAERRGLRGIIFTCHNPVPGDWSPEYRMELDEFDEYVALVARTREEWLGRVDVRLGMEFDYIPGMKNWIETLMERAQFQYRLGSVHAPITDYMERFFYGDILRFQRIYFDHIAQAAETGLFHAIAHPDVVKHAIPSRWRVEEVMDELKRSLDCIAAAGTALEFNTSGANKIPSEMNPGREMLREMKARDIPVVIGSDSHTPDRVGDRFEEAFDALLEAGYRSVCYFIDGEKREISIEEAKASLLVHAV